MIRLIGAGFGRTGTLSLKHALEKLGLDKCYHMAEVMKNPQHMPVWQAAHNGESIDWAESKCVIRNRSDTVATAPFVGC